MGTVRWPLVPLVVVLCLVVCVLLGIRIEGWPPPAIPNGPRFEKPFHVVSVRQAAVAVGVVAALLLLMLASARSNLRHVSIDPTIAAGLFAFGLLSMFGNFVFAVGKLLRLRAEAGHADILGRLTSTRARLLSLRGSIQPSGARQTTSPKETPQ